MTSCVKVLNSVKQARKTFTTLSFEELDALKLDKNSENKCYYEYITKDQKEFRLFFDNDKFNNENNLKKYLMALWNLSTKSTFIGNISLAWYTNNLDLSQRLPIAFRKDSTKFVSIHVCFSENKLKKEDYIKLTNAKYNKLRISPSEDDADVTFGNLENCDGSIYSFLTSEQLMRLPFSFKEDSKHGFNILDTRCSIVSLSDLSSYLETGTWVQDKYFEYLPASSQTITCNGEETLLDIKDLEELGLFEESEVYVEEVKNNFFKNLGIKEEIVTKMAPEDEEEWIMLNKIVKNIYEDSGKRGNKTKELMNSMFGIIVSACKSKFPIDEIYSLITSWFNTDKFGNDWKHASLTYVLDNYFDKFFEVNLNKYTERSKFAYLDALLKLVPDVPEKKTLTEELKAFKNDHMIDNMKLNVYELPKIEEEAETNNEINEEELPEIDEDAEDNEEEITEEESKEVAKNIPIKINLHAFETIKYHACEEFEGKSFDERKILIVESTRYIKNRGTIIYWIDRNNEILEIKATEFKSNILPTLFAPNEVKIIYNSILLNCYLRTNDYDKGFGILDLYKGHPLSYVQDKCPETKATHIKLFDDYLNYILKNPNKDEETKVKEYFLNWLTALVKMPGEFETAIILLVGDHGNGKTLLSKLIAFLLHDKPTRNFNSKREMFLNNDYTSYEDTLTDHISRFNSNTAKRIFSAVQELEGNSDLESVYKIVDALKRLTEPSKRSEKKGIDPGISQNIMQLMLCVNSKRSIPIEETERRYLCIQTNEEHCKDKTFFKTYYQGFSEPYFLKHIFDYLCSRDCSSLYTDEIPTTRLYLNMKLASLKAVTKFVFNYYDKCMEGLTYTDFLKIVAKKPSIIGSYKSADKFWNDYLANFNCTAKLDLYKPDKNKLERISELKEEYLNVYGEMDDEVDTGDDSENDSETSNLTLKTIQELAHKQESKKGNYYYILNKELNDRYNAKELKIKLEACDDWKADKNLGIKKNQRGFKIPEKAFEPFLKTLQPVIL